MIMYMFMTFYAVFGIAIVLFNLLLWVLEQCLLALTDMIKYVHISLDRILNNMEKYIDTWSGK